MSAPVIPSKEGDIEQKNSEGVLSRAREKFKYCKAWYDEAYRNFRQDTMFANADARNNWQWPERVFNQRDGDDRPCLTINKTRVHNRMVINESLQNKASIRIRPVGGQASFEAAKVMQSLVDRIEYISKAQIHYKRAITHQIEGGIGYATLETGYVDDKSFDQDIYIRGVKDPTCVFLDPDISEPDGSDADYGFVFERMLRKKFNKKYPKFKNKIGTSTLGMDENWITDEHVLLCMFYERTNKKDELITYTPEDGGEPFSGHKSEIEPELYKIVEAQIRAGDLDGNIREVTTQDVKWYLIGGDQIINKGDWIGRYIPIARLIGEETIVDGKLDLKGLTRYLIDQQRMFNYNASAQIEFGALQSKTPYTGAAAAFEGQEQWKDSNRKNYAFLQFNHLDDEGEPIPPQALPQRQQPPTAAPIYAEGMKDAQEQMMAASGQYQAQMGENENAKSGRAISERQRQGDTATYDFTDNQYDFYRHLGVMVLDLIPKVYDTKRIHQIMADDGTPTMITIDPDAEETLKEVKKDEEGIEVIFNPSKGEYSVLSDPGPNYATQRQEAWEAGVQILQQNMELTSVIGDLLFRNGDFAGADEIAERLMKEIKATKPYLFDDNATPQLANLQAQAQRLTALNSELMTKLADEKLKVRGRDERNDINAFKADTDRMKVEIEAIVEGILDQREREKMAHEVTLRGHEHVYTMVEQANAADIAASNQGTDSSAS
jgi:hypothetical protein